MPNSFFKFKRFTVFHDQCAMKVGTDGVLIGAWTDTGDAKKALDVGTGSGLISLILAQRNPNLQIDAIDIDAAAILQASYNCLSSEFNKQINCVQSSFANWNLDVMSGYDLIVSNPPFFTDSLKSQDVQRSLARHADALTLDELFANSQRLLNPSGVLSFIYPFSDKERIVKLAEKYHFYPKRITNVYPTSNSLPKRLLLEMSFHPKSLVESDLAIETSRHCYSPDFQYLVKDLYLDKG